MLRPFTLHRPPSVENACALLAELGDDAVAYAGGTELLLLMKEGLLRPRHLVDVKRIPGLDRIAHGDGRLTIGATVTHRVLERSATARAWCPVVASVARHVANVRVRNVGTVGGNLAFADPHSDLATLFLALDARIQLVSPRGLREMPLDAFVRGPWDTVRAADERVTSVTMASWRERSAAAYVKFGMYERPTLGIAVALRLDLDARRIEDARIAIGCVNPRPARAHPADDLHGSADYKREMVAVFTRRALRVAAARARGHEPATRFTQAVVA
jgi:carbon-monoxide dehydrogenase medium subunit